MHRMVYEKPFGRDLASAHEINDCIYGSLHESQVYRIDHYLTKEIVSNIAMIRFSNIVFEPLWNNNFVESVEIVLSEEVGVEGRGAYYDRYGALRDVVQNHALELVALIAMEAPDNLVGDAVRERRATVLKDVRVVDGLLGQYDGYQQEVGVAKNSTTETFAALVLNVNNERWAGVPFYIITGKRLAKKETKIVVRFKNVDCLLTKGCPMESNHLTIQIAPTASFTLSLNAKKIGSVDELEPIKMDYCHSCQFGSAQPEDYGAVFAQVMAGETAISVRFDEIESAWRVIDTAYAQNFPLYRYQQGSTGPDDCRALAQKYKIRG
jgi:glucose-6-phosphate 1-dehydrogenase